MLARHIIATRQIEIIDFYSVILASGVRGWVLVYLVPVPGGDFIVSVITTLVLR